ncbi:NADH dehydrogenase [ubiquinone] 1 beta subcomplex subunit 10-like [Ylistrum balloti]|uniref:NADH dehydrogenase [ubiquinone] 1 beta subcomplex subunit 10-like n=1 Tax=Ylistrum balloti TaxID=509963 RepID=UPI002905C53B|nr:NADH dehydrogenase [ubiquinone] 1 beta subcomplex subunit 10-like [Ylistrum balloti]
MSGDDGKLSVYSQYARAVFSLLLDVPSTFIKGTVDTFRGEKKTVPYYHRRFNRVPTIDECYTDDELCRFEANQQFKRDKQVDSDIVYILRKRYLRCALSDLYNRDTTCKEVKETFHKARDDWMIKYGHLPVYYDVVNAYMKQKHRMVNERRMQEKAANEEGMAESGGEMVEE